MSVEVEMRDCFQAFSPLAPISVMIALRYDLYDAGMRRTEVTSIVSPKAATRGVLDAFDVHASACKPAA